MTLQSFLNELYLDVKQGSITIKLLLSMIVVIAIVFPIVAGLCNSSLIQCPKYLFESSLVIGAIASANLLVFVIIPLIIGNALNCCYAYVWPPETTPPMHAYLSFRDSFRGRF